MKIKGITNWGVGLFVALLAVALVQYSGNVADLKADVSDSGSTQFGTDCIAENTFNVPTDVDMTFSFPSTASGMTPAATTITVAGDVTLSNVSSSSTSTGTVAETVSAEDAGGADAVPGDSPCRWSPY